MTEEEARAHQEELSKHFDLSYWYGTNCKKCCGVYPKFHSGTVLHPCCWYECEVCGSRTEEKPMPWIARDAWNNGEVSEPQLSLF